MTDFPPPTGITEPLTYHIAPRVSGLAIAAFTLGILAMGTFFIGGGVLGVAAIILSTIAIRQIQKNPDLAGGIGFARAGEALAVASIVATVFYLIVPALNGPRIHVTRLNTETQLNGLESAIRKYALEFGDLPGLYPQLATNGGCQTVTNKHVSALATADCKISGTQNLLLATAYSLNNSGTGVQIPGGRNNAFTSRGVVYDPPYVDVTLTGGPASFSPARSWPPFYSPTRDDLKTCAAGFRLTDVPYAWNTAGGTSAFPVIVDRYADPLPILYFRRDQVSGVLCADNTSTPASYYRQENSEYLDGVVYSASGVAYDQRAQSSYSRMSPMAASNLGVAIAIAAGGSSRGDFILLSAGPDRVYGIKSGSTVSDDQFHLGNK
jgi:hypothetical protein